MARGWLSKLVLLLCLLGSGSLLAQQACSDLFADPSGVNPNLGANGISPFDLANVPWQNTPWPASGTTLAGGSYYFGSFTPDNNYSLSIAPAAQVTIFVNGSVNILNNIDINISGTPNQLTIVVNGSVLINNNATINGLLYAAGSIDIKNNNVVVGGLAASGAISIGNNTDITRDEDAINSLQLPGLCRSSLPIVREINHFRILHSGTGLTCAAEPVTVEACANDDCSERFTGEVSLTMSPATGWVGGPDYTQNGPVFNGSGGRFALALSSNTADSRTLAITSSVPTAQNTTRCISPGGSCQLTFNDIGIQLDGDNVDEMKSAIPTQLTGKPSNVGYNSKQQRLRVVKANETTGACEVAVRSKTLDVQFSYNVPVAVNGLTDNRITLTSAGNQQTLVSANATRTLPLQFDNQGNGYFSIISQDAGSYTLSAAMNVPVTDPNETELTTTLARSDSSLPFTVRPLALYAAAQGNNGAVAATGPAFRAAGDAFNLSVQAASWQPGLDENNDGQWDQCSLPDLGVPAISPRLPAWQLTQHQPSLRLPAIADGGVAGTLEYDDNLSFSAGNSISNTARVNHSEVGIVQFASSASFQGQPLEVCSGYIGRFYPANIAIERRPATPAVEMYTPACDSFSYMGQPFAIDVMFKALNATGNVTENYSGNFATADFEVVAETNTEPVESRLMFEPTSVLLNGYSLEWDKGLSSVADAKLSLIRKMDKDGPYMLNALTSEDTRVRLGAKIINEQDGVLIAPADLSFNIDAKQLSNVAADFRYGRLVLDNAYGPEYDNLPLVLRAEYWDGTRFTTNLQDNCSVLSATAVVQPDSNNPALVLHKEEPYTGADTTTINAQASAATIQQGSSVINGIPALLLPATAQRGRGDMEYQASPWLQYYWRDEAVNYQQNPTAEFMFGRYRGNPRQIYWRERFNY